MDDLPIARHVSTLSRTSPVNFFPSAPPKQAPTAQQGRGRIEAKKRNIKV